MIARRVEALIAGDRLNRAEFMRRWQSMPEVERAELIGGVVYMPSPVGLDHGESDNPLATWLGTYAAYTPGCKAGNNTTWYMLDDAPQLDGHLRILPECGGQSQIARGFGQGAPELAAETSRSSSAYDLHQKKELYEAAGVREYVVHLLNEQEIRWFRLVGDHYQRLATGRDGIIRSHAFPGLWLDVPAFVQGKMTHVLEILQQGLASPVHASFVVDLESKQNDRTKKSRRRR